MPPPYFAIHPDEVALGTAFIVAAARAVRRGGGLVAAWDYTHRMEPLLSSDIGVAQMLDAVPDGPAASFCFRTALGPRSPGLVSALSTQERGGLFFQPPLNALAAEVQAGGFGLIVSNGLRTLPTDADAQVPFHPGILRINPCSWGARVHDRDIFAHSRFPTLVVSDQVAAGCHSAHEILDSCARLAAYMAADLRAAA